MAMAMAMAMATGSVQSAHLFAALRHLAHRVAVGDLRERRDVQRARHDPVRPGDHRAPQHYMYSTCTRKLTVPVQYSISFVYKLHEIDRYRLVMHNH